MTSNQQVIHAYRHLYRSALQAVQYARPNRFIARDQIRSAFRERGAQMDSEGVKRTIWFLQAAAKEKGLEHKIVKNLLEVRGRSRPGGRKGWSGVYGASKSKTPFTEHKMAAFDHYNMTVAMLNKTMGLCLR